MKKYNRILFERDVKKKLIAMFVSDMSVDKKRNVRRPESVAITEIEFL